VVNAGEEWNVYTYEMRQVGGTRAVVNLDPYGPECQAPPFGIVAVWHPGILPPPPLPPLTIIMASCPGGHNATMPRQGGWQPALGGLWRGAEACA